MEIGRGHLLPAFITLAVLVALLVPGAAFAASSGNMGDMWGKGFGPFEAFLTRGSELFAYTRNALYVVAAFAFIVYAWKAIQGDGVDWKGLFYLIVALILLGVAGFMVGWLADNTETGQKQLQNSFPYLQDTRWR